MIHQRPPEDLTPADRLEAMRCWISSGITLPAHWRAFLVDSLEQAARGESIDRMWGLSAPGQRSLKTQRLTAQRDAALRKAWRRLPGTPWQRSQELAHRIRRYQATGWPRDRDRGAPASTDEVRACLFQAMSSAPVPASAVQLNRICKPS